MKTISAVLGMLAAVGMVAVLTVFGLPTVGNVRHEIHKVEIYADGDMIRSLEGEHFLVHDTGPGELLFRPIPIQVPRHTTQLLIIGKNGKGEEVKVDELNFFGILTEGVGIATMNGNAIKVDGRTVGFLCNEQDSEGHLVAKFKFFSGDVTDAQYQTVLNSAPN